MIKFINENGNQRHEDKNTWINALTDLLFKFLKKYMPSRGCTRV